MADDPPHTSEKIISADRQSTVLGWTGRGQAARRSASFLCSRRSSILSFILR